MNTMPATNAKIIDTYKTYEQVNGKMVHNGYFVLLQDAPLKWASIWQYNTIMALTPFKRITSAYKLTNAQ